MDQLSYYAALAEITGVVAIIVGGLFALVQLSEFRKRRRYQVAAELCRAFADPDLGRAVVLIRLLPDGISAQQLRAMGAEYEASAQLVGMAFETMGLQVYEDLASFRIIQSLTGGLLLTLWRKLAVWAEDVRIESGNARFAEWVQWLAERLAEQEQEIVPAHRAFADWRPRPR